MASLGGGEGNRRLGGLFVGVGGDFGWGSMERRRQGLEELGHGVLSVLDLYFFRILMSMVT
jgi:hypothetical protein